MPDYKNIINNNTPLIKIEDPLLKEFEVTLLVKREDLNHPQLSGNKWHKLKYNLQQAEKEGYDTLLTFGGAYSNHIYATAAAGKLFGFKTIGVIRGEEHLPLNPTLSFAKESGMLLHYLDREKYRRKNDSDVVENLKNAFGNFYLIPEGGSNKLAVIGCSEIPKLINEDYDYICCACGTGGTLAGIASGLPAGKKALGFAVLKNAGFLSNAVKNFLDQNNSNSREIFLDYHFNGYAKWNDELISFIKRFKRVNKIPIEPVYTAKMFYGIYDLIMQDYFKKNSRIVALHTGGLQGAAGFKKRFKINF